MESAQIFQTLLAFVFVLGLMFITLWLIKFCQQKGLNCRLNKSFNAKNRLRVIEQRRLDIKNSLVLLECDSQEYLILLGANSNLLLNTAQSKAKVAHHD